MSDEARNFVRTLLESPDDPAGLLVFADWLEENGDPRSELVRVQGELARWEPDHERRGELERRQERLRHSLADAWLGPLAASCKEHRFERGLAHITLDARKLTGRRFANEAGRWFREALVGTVRLEGLRPACLHALATAPCLGDVLGLDLNGVRLPGQALSLLLSNPHLRQMTWLDLSNNALGDAELQKLLAWPGFSQLAWLDLRNNNITSGAARSLLRALGPRLRWLDLTGNPLDDDLARTVNEWRGENNVFFQGERPRRLVNSIGMEFALIPAGSFLMGSPDDEAERRRDEGPRHAVTLTRSFYLGVYPVTQQQYLALTHSNPSYFSPMQGRGGPFHPVESLTWEMAVEFCNALSSLPVESEARRHYRLPTEAEWEHACRGGTSLHPFCWGPSVSSREASFDGRHPFGGGGRGRSPESTTPVGTYRQFHPFGLHDVYGNVFEWCQDLYGPDFYHDSPKENPAWLEEPGLVGRRIVRGGSWMHHGGMLRAASRMHKGRQSRESYVGLRVALDVE